MFSFAQSAGGHKAYAQPQEQQLYQRVAVRLQGRLMLANYDEFNCVVAEMSPGDLLVETFARPERGEKIIAYIDHLGRVEGKAVQVTDRGFTMSINATERKREKLAAQLTWLANKHELGLPEDRRHDRLIPRNGLTEITFEDGRRYTCRLLDLSLSGAAIDVEIRPEVGSVVRIGTLRAKVVRHFLEGVALEFFTQQTLESLRDFL